MKTCPCISAALRVSVLCAIVVLSCAFDWKPKSVPKLKADLVAYARSVGETKFADEVEKTTSTAGWMRLAFRHGAKLLKESEGGDFDDKKRMYGLRIIDYPLHLDNISTNTAPADQRESYWEMYTRKDRLGDRRFPWPRVHPLGYGESITVSHAHAR